MKMIPRRPSSLRADSPPPPPLLLFLLLVADMLLFLLLVVLVRPTSTTGSTCAADAAVHVPSTHQTRRSVMIDLSHQPHIVGKSNKILLTQQVLKWKKQQQKQKQHQEELSSASIVRLLLLDLSDSRLTDEDLMDALLLMLPGGVSSDNTTTTTSPHYIVIEEFRAHMNRFTSIGVAKFLNRLLIVNNRTTTMKIQRLDLGWNKLESGKEYHQALQNLLSSSSSSTTNTKDCCSDTIALQCTNMGPATCRAVARGLLHRWKKQKAGAAEQAKKKSNTTTTTTIADDDDGDETDLLLPRPLSLILSCNEELGDGGVAALAAALRSVAVVDNTDDDDDANTRSSKKPITIPPASFVVLDTLDLSNCQVGDAGVQALALALEEGEMLRHLILSQNHAISDEGMQSLCRSLTRLNTLDASSNHGITDRSVASIADAIEEGRLGNISLRSCAIHADGAERIGQLLRRAKKIPKKENNSQQETLSIDLSGNPIGILRGKSKSGGSSGGGKYSASRLKSQAGATATAFMSQGLSFLKKTAADLGGANRPSDLSSSSSSTLESDDDEDDDKQINNNGSSTSDDSNKRCGFKAMADAFLENRGQLSEGCCRKIQLGLRRTFCDTAGADALAALLVAAEEDGLQLTIDVDLNPLLEPETRDALSGRDDDLLHEMADRHMDALDVLRQSQERAALAARGAARVRAQQQAAARDDQFPEAPFLGHEEEEEFEGHDEDWDSDADYEDEDDEEYY